MSVGAPNFRSAEEIIHGMQVRDPFRWLEDRGLSETQRWIDAQRASCEAYFAGCQALPILRNRVRMLLDTETLDQPVAAGEYRFYRRREQGREQASIYVCNTTTGAERCLVEPSGWGPFASVTIHRVSDDGRIPLTLVALPGTSFHQNQPVIMTGYGGFGAPLTPQYSVLVNIMLELGAIFVVPHVRGGGEFGSSWHEAARGASRQTAVEDFTRAAEWLCSEGITTPRRLAIFGGSNAGLLVAAAMTGKPGLFRAVLSIAPLLDMVRYERFDQAAKWRSEYGSVANAAEFGALLSYSPYHQVRRNIDYPAVLFVTGDSDDRCNPAHVRKMAARLQERAAQHHPVLVDYSAERGHSPVLPLSVRIEALARRIAFLCRELGIQVCKEEWNDVTCH